MSASVDEVISNALVRPTLVLMFVLRIKYANDSGIGLYVC